MNKHISTRKIVINSLPFLLALIVLILVRVSSSFPGKVEEYYSRGIYPAIAGILSGISSFIKYSLYDLFWIFMSLFILTGLFLVILRKIRPGRYILRFCQLVAILYSLFYISWGFNYFRQDLRTRLGWSVMKPDETSFRSVLDSLISSANRTFTKVSRDDYPSIDESLEKSFSRCRDILSISYPNGSRHPKTILVSSYFAKSGISGYFGPYFNEVHINFYQLPGDYPFIVAHEKAHQFGFANEADANMAAFIVCSNSPDKRLQYSGYKHLLLYFLNDARNLPDYHNYLSKIDAGVLNDIRTGEDYYDDLRNKKLEKIQTAANDVYLKSQHIAQGVKNYNQVVSLTIGWYAETGKLPLSTAPDFAGLSEKSPR
ncbi:MAG TPA: DUF3810 domain-containing protein [Bacteroidales bacterium]|nr:DUF3810 domain-containing protein [Bacteroidales bacterium]